jgi:hypothetical protein
VAGAGLPVEELPILQAAFWGGDVPTKTWCRSAFATPRCKTALLSNAWSHLRDWLENLWHIADAFDEIIISSEIGVAKPDERAFRFALERLGVAPQEAVFVDDFSENVDAARRVGMQVILFKPHVQVEAELDRLLEEDDRRIAEDERRMKRVLLSSFVACSGETMDYTDFTDLTLSEASQRIARREVSPVELTRACLERIQAVDPQINSFITVTAETALERAHQAEVEIGRSGPKSPLHGIPLALKDLYETQGVRTTAGSRFFADYVPIPRRTASRWSGSRRPGLSCWVNSICTRSPWD